MDLPSIWLRPELGLDEGGLMNMNDKMGTPKGDADTPQFDNSTDYETACSGTVPTVVRSPVQAQDHVLAERKRREKINGQFISMSALLPNLKKMDKASVLEDAINYIRELQDRVKELEGKIKDAKKSSITLNISSLSSDDKSDSSSHQTKSEDSSEDVPCNSSAEIKVQMSGSNVLVKIQSQQNSSSLLVKVLKKMHKLGLSIISSASMPFADTATLITIVAQTEDGFHLTAEDLVRNLQLSL